jgi:fused signal recognition particle receptor
MFEGDPAANIFIIILAVGSGATIAYYLGKSFLHFMREQERHEREELATLGGADFNESTYRVHEMVIAATDQYAKPYGATDAMRKGLSKTHERIKKAFRRIQDNSKLSVSDFKEIEEILYNTDLARETTSKLVNNIKHKFEAEDLEPSSSSFKNALREQILNVFSEQEKDPAIRRSLETPDQWKDKPHTIVVMGDRGAGKTTVVGKLAVRYAREGLSVLLGEGDTHRRNEFDELSKWAELSTARLMKCDQGTAPSSVAGRALEAAKKEKRDVCIIDTAGRFYADKDSEWDLLEMQKTMHAILPNAPQETLYVVDSNVGQQVIESIKYFHERVGITGLVVSKLASSSRGGAVISLADQLDIPVHYIDVGEEVEDLRVFDGKAFSEAFVDFDKADRPVLG